MDKNDNAICDEDEADDPFFVEPDYVEPVETVEDEPEPEETEPYVDPIYNPIEEPEPEGTFYPEVEEPPESKYTSKPKEPELRNWKSENDMMSLEITKMYIEINDVENPARYEEAQEAILKTVHLTIRNKAFKYLNPRLFFNVEDEKDSLIIRDTMQCDQSDDLFMEGCKNAIPEAEEVNVIMHVDKKIPRLDMEKTFTFRFENERDDKTEYLLAIEKQYYIDKVPGAIYS